MPIGDLWVGSEWLFDNRSWQTRSEEVHMDRWRCPFCGEHGKSTKEHVWPKWLREAPGIGDLLSSARGERFEYEYNDLRFVDGRAVEIPRSVSVARWVPQITAQVCARCNNEWMSRLETRVRRMLSALVLQGAPVVLSAMQVRDLATWGVKTAMTYQLALRMDQGAFTVSDYRGMAKAQAIPNRCKVWVRSSEGPQQYVATQYRGLVVPVLDELVEPTARDGLAFILIALPQLFIVVGVAPEADEVRVLDLLTPTGFGTDVGPQIWPEPGPLILPTQASPESFDPQEVFADIEALGESSVPLSELSPEALLRKAEDPGVGQALLEAALDSFAVECEADALEPSSAVDQVLFVLGGPLSPAQLSRLFGSALALVNKHADDRPTLVARRLFNIAHVLFASEAYPASVVIALMCGTLQGGGYEERADLWELAGRGAWQIAAFDLAEDLYRSQLEFDPESRLARYNAAHSAMLAGRFREAGALLGDLAVEDPQHLADGLACLRVTLRLFVEVLGLESLDGYGGIDAEELVQHVVAGEHPDFQTAWAFQAEASRLLKGVGADQGLLVAIADAFIVDTPELWADATVLLLQAGGTHPLLPAVIRKGASTGADYGRLLKGPVARKRCPDRLPDGRDIVEMAMSSHYPRKQRRIRLLDDEGRIVGQY